MAVREATLRAIERARKDGSPTLFRNELLSLSRTLMSDPGNYRTQEKSKNINNAIRFFSTKSRKAKIIDDKALAEMEEKVAEKGSTMC